MNPTKIHDVKRLDSLIPKAPRTLHVRQRTYILGRYTLVCVEGDAHHGPTLQIVKVEAAVPTLTTAPDPPNSASEFE
jgi:hypothetical protein